MGSESNVLKLIAVAIKIKINKKRWEKRQLSTNSLGPKLEVRIIGS